MSETPLPGPLDDFLNHPPCVEDRPERRATLLRETTAVVQRRRRRVVVWRWLARAAAVLLVIAIVEAVMQLRRTPEAPVPQPPAPQAHQAPQPKPVVEPKPTPTAVALEWQAFDAPRAKQTALYLQAGDRYVEERHDLDGAVRCYGQAVHAAPNVEIDPNDNWLVLALKMDEIDRRKEK